MPSLPVHAQRMPLSQEGWAETPELIFHPLGLILQPLSPPQRPLPPRWLPSLAACWLCDLRQTFTSLSCFPPYLTGRSEALWEY